MQNQSISGFLDKYDGLVLPLDPAFLYFIHKKFMTQLCLNMTNFNTFHVKQDSLGENRWIFRLRTNIENRGRSKASEAGKLAGKSLLY